MDLSSVFAQEICYICLSAPYSKNYNSVDFNRINLVLVALSHIIELFIFFLYFQKQTVP